MTIDKVINSLFSSCTYVVDVGESSVWLVDCGDVEPLIGLLQGKIIKGVLLTHSHFDHIYGLNELLGLYPETLVFTNEFGREALLDAKQNMSRYHETPFVFNYPGNIRVIGDGNVIELADGLKADVVATPGHNPSCLTYIIDDSVFSGDSYIPDVKVVTNLPRSDKALAQESLKRILGLAENRVVYPGHHVDNNLS